MGLKKIMLMTLLLLILTIGAVSAADNNTNTPVGIDNTPSDIVGVENDNQVLEELDNYENLISKDNDGDALADPDTVDLSVTIVCEDCHVGDATVVRITASNSGPSDATGAQVTFTPPAALSVAGSNASTGSYDGTTWAIGSLAASDSASLEITCNAIAPSNSALTATITSDQFDSNSSNNIASTTIAITPIVDLAITLETVTDCNVGDTVVVRITASNSGPSDASGAQVTFTPPAALSVAGSDASTGSYDGTTWTIGSLAASGSATLDITCNAITPFNGTLSATITSIESDSNTSNNMASKNIAITLVVDLAITLEANVTESIAIGDTILVTATASNPGPTDASGVSVTFMWPPSTDINPSYPPSTGSFDGVVWTIGDLASTQTATLMIACRAMAAGNYSLAATIDSTESDLNSSNNVDILNLTFTRKTPELSIDVTDTGNDVTIVINTSADATGNVTVTISGSEILADIAEGSTTVNISRPDAGTYLVIVRYNGNSNYSPAEKSTMITITPHEKTFSELATLIGAAGEGAVIELDADYINNGSVSADGISILKSLTIDGKGHTLDAKNISRIFINDGYAPNIVLRNIAFKNGYSPTNGGAVCINGAYANITNCSFINCSAKGESGAVYLEFDETGSEGVFNNCIFINCTAGNEGGAISGLLSVNNCNFTNCSAKDGGATYGGFNVTNSIFTNCLATDGGGAIFNADAKNCTFRNCTADSGGAVCFMWGLNYDIVNCSFMNCSANSGGAVCLDYGSEGNIANCIFMNCSATNRGGAVYAEEDSTTRITSSYFKNNKATRGGAISGGIVFECKFENNTNPEVISSDDYSNIVPEESKANNAGKVTIIFPNDAEGTVEVFVNGTSVAVVKITNGIAQIDLSKYSGNIEVTFVYSGDDNYPGFIRNSTVYVNPAIISASSVKVLYTACPQYKIKVYESKGVIAAKETVVVKSNGKKYKTLTTNSNGIASFKIEKIPGTYKLTITSLGKTVTKTLTVKHIVTLKTVKVRRSAKKLVLTATLSKVNKKYLKNKKITFKFNGKTYTAKTNKKGVAKVTVNQNVLKKLKVGKKVTYQATYRKDTVKKTVKINK